MEEIKSSPREDQCGIYERTHNKPRPQQQDEMKLRRNPTPPPSLGGYEPLEYDDDDEDEDEDEEEESSPVSQYSRIDTDQVSSPMVESAGNEDQSPQPVGVEMEVEMSVPERHQFEESVCRDERSQITPVSISNSPPSPSPQIQIVQPFPLLFLPPTTQASVNEIISLSQPQPQPFLDLNAPLDTDSRQLPPLRTVTSYWNSQPTSGSASVVPSPTTPITGNGSDVVNSIGHGNGNRGWEGKIALTPYSRPGSRSDLRSVSTTSLRGVDSGRW